MLTKNPNPPPKAVSPDPIIISTGNGSVNTVSTGEVVDVTYGNNTPSSGGGDDSAPPADAPKLDNPPENEAIIRPDETAPEPNFITPITIDYNDVRASLDFVRALKYERRQWYQDSSTHIIVDRLRDWRAMLSVESGSLSTYFLKEINKYIPPEEKFV